MCYINCGEAKELHLSSDDAESVAVLNIKLVLSCLSCWLRAWESPKYLLSALCPADSCHCNAALALRKGGRQADTRLPPSVRLVRRGH